MANNYVHGSAARKLNSENERTYDRPVRRQFTEPAIKRNKQITVQWTPLYVIMLSSIVVLFIAVTMNNIQLNAEIASLRVEKGTLTSEYEKLVLSNNLYYDNIISNVDVEEIKRIAIAELGMTRPAAGQLQYYSGDMEDYVKQYSDMPGN